MTSSNISTPIVLPSGTYYVGDPCYVFDHPSWDALGEQTDWFETPLATLAGRSLVVFGTAYGDGTYADLDGNLYPVDAGLIGVVPVELIERGVITGQAIAHAPGIEPFGRIVTFYAPFKCYTYQDPDRHSGRPNELHFGAIAIETDPVVDYLDDDDDDR